MAYLLYQICQKICQKPAKPENVPNHHVQWTRCKLFSICFGWISINTKVQGISNTQFYYIIFHLRKKPKWWKEWLVACVAIFSSLDASMTPLPLSPRFPLPPPHLTLNGGESRGPSVWFCTVWFNQHDASAYSKKLLERGDWADDARWVMSRPIIMLFNHTNTRLFESRMTSNESSAVYLTGEDYTYGVTSSRVLQQSWFILVTRLRFLPSI